MTTHPTPPCCEAWPAWADDAAWYADEDDPTVLINPHLAGTRHRINYCPSCGSDRRSATSTWLRENPPGQPVAIEPRGCPTPGACSCVDPAPEPAPAVRYEFEVVDEDDLTLASGDAATLEEAEREGRRYLAQYSQDGPCTLEVRRVEVLEVSSPGPQPEPAAAEPPLWRSMERAYNDAPQPFGPTWIGRDGYAAEILAVRDRVAPEEAPPVAPTDSPAWLHWQQRQAIRALLTTEAARAEAGE